MKKPTKKQIASFTATIVGAKLKDEKVDVYVALLELYKIGVTYIDAEFSGSGDSGDLHEICYYPSEDKTAYNDEVEIGDIKTEKFRDWLYDIFQSNVTCDWYNNDGGGGHVFLKLPSLDVRITSFWNETVSNECDELELNVNPCKEEE
jgi:hypothetical protein